MSMASLHPQITHFPVALIITAFLLQIIVILKPTWVSRSTPLWLLGMAVIFSFIATLSGQDAANVAVLTTELENPARSLIIKHRAFATFTVWSSLGVLIGWLWFFLKYRDDRRVDVLSLLFLLLLSVSVGVTAYLGGELVMTHGVGVG